jgi:hypothetical protein
MDIICPRCAEPMDLYELHEFNSSESYLGAIPMTFDEARKVFFDPSQGCGQLFNGKPCDKVESIAADASALLADMLGDDVDGIAAMMEDFEYMGMLE